MEYLQIRFTKLKLHLKLKNLSQLENFHLRTDHNRWCPTLKSNSMVPTRVDNTTENTHNDAACAKQPVQYHTYFPLATHVTARETLNMRRPIKVARRDVNVRFYACAVMLDEAPGILGVAELFTT